MPRSVKPWVGKTDDTPPPPRVKLRILHRQNFKCALTGADIKAGDRVEFDHAVELIMGGKNTEDNLQAVLSEPHKEKTRAAQKRKKKADHVAKANFNLRTRPVQPICSAPFAKSSKTANRGEKLPIPPRVKDIFRRPL